MSEVRALIEQLVDAGVDPITAAEVITRAAIAGAKDAACPVDEAAERRRAADRERKRAERLRKSADVTECPQTSADNADKEQKEIPPQTPLKKNNIYTPPIAPPSESRPRGTRLPKDWFPDPLPADFKNKHALTDEHCAEQLEQFRDYWAAAPGQKGVKLDWQATWRVWLRNSRRSQPRGSPTRKTAFQNTMTNLAEIFADEQQEENDRDAIRKLSVSR